MRLLTLLLALLTLAFAPIPKPKPRDDLRLMRGAWKAVNTVEGEELTSPAQVAVWRISGDQVSATLDGRWGRTFTLHLGSGAWPRPLYLTPAGGDLPFEGTYDLEGDTLTVRFSQGKPPGLPGGGRYGGVW